MYNSSDIIARVSFWPDIYTRGPNIAVPMRTCVAPASIARG